MEGCLRQRQQRLLEAICAQFKVPVRRQQQIAEWIAEGTFQTHAEAAAKRASDRRRRAGVTEH